VPVDVVDDPGAGLLVARYERAEIFRIEAVRQFGRTDDIAEHDGELAALGLMALRTLIAVDENFPVIVNGDALGVDEVSLDILDVFIVKAKSPF